MICNKCKSEIIVDKERYISILHRDKTSPLHNDEVNLCWLCAMDLGLASIGGLVRNY